MLLTLHRDILPVGGHECLQIMQSTFSSLDIDLSVTKAALASTQIFNVHYNLDSSAPVSSGPRSLYFIDLSQFYGDR